MEAAFKVVRYALILAAAALVLGCLSQENGKTYTQTQLKYLLLDHYGEENFFFCDPDYYPIARGNETEKALEVFPEIQNDSELFGAIISRKGISAPFSDEEKLAIYREFKKLRALGLEQAGQAYNYSMRIGDEQEGYSVSGTIDRHGRISERSREKGILTCPICLSGETMIGTPEGSINVKDLREGMMVLTRSPDGSAGSAPVLRVSKTKVPAGHEMVRLRLSDGRELYASRGHPTMDGRIVGDLAPGDTLDGALVVSAGPAAYGEDYTYDLLPAGSGGYFANGIYLGSTLR